MLLAVKVVDGLHRIEGRKGHLYKYGIPVAHGTVPKSGKLQSLQLLAVLALVGNETSGRVYIVGQRELDAVEIADGADEVDGIKVCAILKHGLLLGVAHINLAALKHLQTDCAVGVIGKEWTSAGLTHVAHHTADAHRTVELAIEIVEEFQTFQTLGGIAVATEVVLHEGEHLLQAGVSNIAALEFLEISKGLALQGDEHTGKEFLIGNGVALQTVGHHVIDVLDEDDVGIDVVEIFNECAMTSGTEEQTAVGIAEGGVVGICSHRIGRGFLLAERNVIDGMVLLGVYLALFGREGFKKRTMLGTYSEVYVHAAVVVLGRAPSTKCSSKGVRAPSS